MSTIPTRQEGVATFRGDLLVDDDDKMNFGFDLDECHDCSFTKDGDGEVCFFKKL